MEHKPKKNIFLKLLGCLFILYISLTIAIESGYYEAKVSEKTMITEEAIKQFESDVKEGKEVLITDYLTDTHKDYSNDATKAGVAISMVVEKIMSEGISKTVDIFKLLFT